MEGRIIGYFCSKHGFYKEEPFICQVCGIEAELHVVIDESSKLSSDQYSNIHIYVNKMKEVTQANARQLLERGY